MGILSLADILSSVVTSVVGAIGSVLCAPLCGKIKAFIDVLNAPQSFFEDTKKLSDLMNDIKAMSHSNYTEEWLLEAENIMEKVPRLLVDLERSSNQNNGLQLSCCMFGHGVSSCKLHMKVRKLMIRGQNIITCANLTIEPVEHILGVPNIEDGSTAERNLKQVIDMLNDDEVWSIGVWGPGGVGMTTLVNTLNNKLKSTSSFSLVILVPLTKDANESEVQKAIGERLNLNVEEGMGIIRIANRIYNRLQKEKFLLILDNVWEAINLTSIGIPENQNCSKVVLTTRLEHVCTKMKAKAMKIGYLTKIEAWQLFAEKAGEVVTNAGIQPIAEALCDECGGLPLLLVAAGSAMRGKTSIHLWQSAINDLRSSIFPSGVESQVYKSLKLSFDFLENGTLKSCFLYCSLYPEGYNILVSQLIRCWQAENIIDEQLTYESAYNKGLELVETLKNSCLLEDGGITEGWLRSIKMHDVVRDIAIQIAKSNGTSIVFSGHGISKSPRVALPEEVENVKWISFVDNKIIELPDYKKDFPRVTTLLLHITRGQVQISEEFLKGFQALRVMNITVVQSFSCSLLHLTKLRALLVRSQINNLEEVQCGSKLMVLDLSFSSVCKLPRIKQKTTIRVLDLSGTLNLKTIDADFILYLGMLEILDMRMSGYKWHTVRRTELNEVVLQDLSRLRLLKEVYLDLADVQATYEEYKWMERLNCFEFYYHHNSLSLHRKRRIFIKNVIGCKVGSFILHAEDLGLWDIVGNVNEIFANFKLENLSNSKLKSLHIENCSFSKGLIGVVPDPTTLPNLESLVLRNNEHVRSFSQIANVFGATFSKLRSLHITHDSNLENVISSDYPHMVLPELEEISIFGCDNITKVFQNCTAKIQAIVPKLKRLELYDLESLQSLCNCKLIGHCEYLESLDVIFCPKLKKLPQMTSTEGIGGEESQKNLECDNPKTRSYKNQFLKTGL